MKRTINLLALATALIAMPAHAKWLEAKTDHFIIDADTSPAEIQAFATKLARFDAALRRLYDVPDSADKRADPVHIFATDQDEIQRDCNCSRGLAGYYQPQAGGSVIFTSILSNSNEKDQLDPQEVLLHEYSHYFMYSNFPVAYPLWYSEGFAEFNANVKFDDDGSVIIGLPANYRAYGIFDANVSLPIEKLLSPPDDVFSDLETMNKIYGRAWLLTHYLTLSPDRHGQLAKYLDAINHGKSSLDAARQAFGNLYKLSRDLGDYARNGKLAKPLRVPVSSKKIDVAVREMTPGEAAMMHVHMRSRAGVTPSEAKSVVRDAEHDAAPFPHDPSVQVWLAEAEYDAGDYAKSDAAASAALAADPDNIRAMLYKGRAASKEAEDAKSDQGAAWATARQWYLKANRLNPDATMPFLLYYESFAQADQKPTPGAVKGLERAAVLAPEATTIRWLLAKNRLGDGDSSMARYLLEPIAYAPHGAQGDNRARKVIDLIDKKDLAAAQSAMADKTPPSD